MDKSSLKVLAMKARQELQQKVEQKAYELGITEEKMKQFTKRNGSANQELARYEQILKKMAASGYSNVIDEVAYTWFIRLAVIRFMEVNNYLPSGVRVLSSTNPRSNVPDMVTNAAQLNFDVELDRHYIAQLKWQNKKERLFKYLLIKQCQELHLYFPFLFDKEDGVAELLFPENLLAEDSFVRHMTDPDILAESNWRNVEVIGWLYQYYQTEARERVIKAKKKYERNEIPYATQVFTPEWIVRYMAQNSLGRYWLEAHRNHSDLLQDWEFYLDSNDVPYINATINVEEISCFDPAMGSGHILVYMFDMLYAMYRKCGYNEKDIPRLIIEKNLYGLDIDDRTYQLACFSLIMRALSYNNSFLQEIKRSPLQMNIVSMQESNLLTEADIVYFAGAAKGNEYKEISRFIKQFYDCKVIGALVKVKHFPKQILEERLQAIGATPARNQTEAKARHKLLEIVPKLIKQATIATKTYDILVTNPPYIKYSRLPTVLQHYVARHYKIGKADLYSAFIEYATIRVKKSGHIGMMTPCIWLTQPSFYDLRHYIIASCNITSLVQLEYSGFSEATVPIVTFTLRNNDASRAGEFVHLRDFVGASEQPLKLREAVQDPTTYYRTKCDTNMFQMLPEQMISGYWAPTKMLQLFRQKKVGDIAQTCTGLQTGNNAKFVRYWFEVALDDTNIKSSQQPKWIKYNEGGELRKWYGNHLSVVNWANNGKEIKSYKSSAVRNERYYLKEGITWKRIGSGGIGLRYMPEGFIFDQSGDALFADEELLYYILAYFNSVVGKEFYKILAPTLNLTAGNMKDFPIIIPEKKKLQQIRKIVSENIAIAKREWDSYELSWDFTIHPLLLYNKKTIEEAVSAWISDCQKNVQIVRTNEETLNKMMLEIYELEDVLSAKIDEKEITLRVPNEKQAVTSFLSYAIGCLFGRYTNHKPVNKRQHILPLVAEEYFEDDLVSNIISFIQRAFSKQTLPENIMYIAKIIGIKQNETALEALRRYFLNEFYREHVQRYKKRPIYWLFTSGKEKAFNCLVYMHNYDKSTLSRIMTDYLRKYRNHLETRRLKKIDIIEGDYAQKEKNMALEKLKGIDKKIKEINEYDEVLQEMAEKQIDIVLDNGIAHNYRLFKGLVAKL